MDKGAWVKNGGLKFFAVDYATLGIIDDSFEPFMDVFQPRTGDYVLDVGANVGKYTFEASRKVGPKGRVIAIEPSPPNFRALARGLVANRAANNTAIFQFAAGDYDGDLTLFWGLNSGTNSSECNQGKGTMRVPCRVLDGLVETLRLRRLDWVKIDVEGAEYSVLRGLVRSLKLLRPRLVVEVWERNEPKVLTLLATLGYDGRRLEELAGIDFNVLGHCSYWLFTPRL